MGKGCGSGFYRNSPCLSPNLNFTGMAPDPGRQSTGPMMWPSYMNANSYPYVAPASSTLPGFTMAVSPYMDRIEPNSWYSCYNSLHPFTMAANSFVEERFSGAPYSIDLHCEKPDLCTLNPTSETTEKKFLVVDQSGNQRSLIFSAICPPLHFTNPVNQRQFDMEVMKDQRNQTMPIIDHCLEQEVDLENGSNETENLGGNESEMHEDTEDLEALLSSDYEEEEASTGHSPSDMTGYKRKEEVASTVPSKRRRFEEKGCGEEEGGVDTSLMDTASSVKGNGCWDNCHGAESSCQKIDKLAFNGEASAKKRSRREKIKKTVGILRTIIPGGKGKDAALVLDEAIRYLKSLQLKAKALGVQQ